jgi:hypothetical protein
MPGKALGLPHRAGACRLGEAVHLVPPQATSDHFGQSSTIGRFAQVNRFAPSPVEDPLLRHTRKVGDTHPSGQFVVLPIDFRQRG